MSLGYDSPLFRIVNEYKLTFEGVQEVMITKLVVLMHDHRRMIIYFPL